MPSDRQPLGPPPAAPPTYVAAGNHMLLLQEWEQQQSGGEVGNATNAAVKGMRNAGDREWTRRSWGGWVRSSFLRTARVSFCGVDGGVSTPLHVEHGN